MVKIKSGFRGERAVILPASIVEELKADQLCGQLFITDIGFYPNAGFHYRRRTKEEANQNILIYCIEGSGWVETNNTKQPVEAGQYFILPKNQAHAYGSNLKTPWSIYWIHFDGKLASYFAENLEKVQKLGTDIDSRIEERVQMFEEIFNSLRNGYSKSNLGYSSACLFHFLGSLKFVGVYRNSLRTGSDESGLISMAIHFMRENIVRKVKVEEIAKFTGLSVSHFTSVFHDKTGYAPIQYLNQLRIQQACHYLDFTDLKINQIAMTIGYPDPFYFSRAFKKEMGCSPAEYRRKVKG